VGRAVAVDWSGARSAAVQRATIWVAEAVDGCLVGLSAGRTRSQTIEWLCGLSGDVVVGLDFGFSFPGWWLAGQGVTTGAEAWALAAAEGEAWLATCPAPFWGRPGTRRPKGVELYRRTEHGLRGVTSVFQIGGAGAVGTGSIRGMPGLAQLRAAGLAVWPFDDWPCDSRPVVAEVWPRLTMGRVVKSSAAARAAWVAPWADVEPWRSVVVDSPDAFDATCAARWLSSRSWAPVAPDQLDRLEGRVLGVRPGSVAEMARRDLTGA
jgi:hypothetical protein